MRKTFLAITLCIMSVAAFAQEKIGSYSMLHKNYDIMATKPSMGEFMYFISVEGGINNHRMVFFLLKGNYTEDFNVAMTLLKEKFIEWKEKAIANGVKDFRKDFPVKLPKMDVCWSGSEWRFSMGHTFTPKFVVYKDGECALLIVGTAQDGYSKQDYYFELKTAAEFDGLLENISREKVDSYYSQKGKTDGLFN